MSNKRRIEKILSNFLFLSLENIFRILVGAFISIWIARYLGPEKYGTFSYILSFGLVFTPFFSMGADDVTISHFIVGKKANILFGSSFMLRGFGGLLGLLLCVITAYFINANDLQKVALISIYVSFLLFKATENINFYYISIEKVKGISLFRNISFFIVSLYRVYLLYYSYQFEYFIYAACLELFLVAVLYVLKFKLDGFNLSSWVFDLDEAKKIVVESFPLFVLIFVQMLMSRIDQLMISHMVGDSILGKYAVAVKLIELWQFLPLAVLTALFPTMVSSYEKDEAIYKKRIETLYGLMFWLSFIFSIFVTSLAPSIIDILYGEKYIGSDVLLSYYCWLSIILFFNFTRNKIFVIEKRYRSILLLAIVSLFLNLYLNYLLIPEYGAVGAIVASLFSYILSNLILCIIDKNIRLNITFFLRGIFTFFNNIKHLKKI